ncbi:MAG: CHASE3 domain-containing protein [Bacteroidota bacterium]
MIEKFQQRKRIKVFKNLNEEILTMKISIGTKIGAGFSLSLIIMIIIGVVSYGSLGRTIESVQLRIHTYLVIQKLEGLLSSLKDAETGQRGYILTNDNKYLAPYHSAVVVIDQQLKSLKDLTVDNQNQQRRLDNLEPLITKKLNELKETITLRKEKGFQSAEKIILTDAGKQIMDDIRKIVESMKNEENDLLKVRQDKMDADWKMTTSIIIYGISIGVLLTALTGFFITRNISGPLIKITNSAKQIASGNLLTDIGYNKRRDEVGVLTQAFNEMISSLKEMANVAQRIAASDLTVSVNPQTENDILGKAFLKMVENLRRIAKELSEGINVLGTSASEILTATTQVASSASETATAVSETSTTVEEVKQTSQVATQKAKYVSDISQKAAQISVTGKKSVDDSISGMNKIREQMESIGESTIKLSEQSQAIGEIIASVNDLADQSNLLAVNAAIEAAKAGEQGKGFTVVAQEIKSLAEQSKQATAQVRSILSDVQKAMSAAVLATEQGMKAVESGVKQSTEAGSSIKVLSDSIMEASQAATQIAASSQQQSVGMDQVALAMENIKQASTQNVVSTKQAETAAQNLHGLGQKLKELVEQYKV